MRAGIWFRIDAGDGSVTVVSGDVVARRARDFFKRPNHAIATGRFRTPFAIFASGDRLTPEESRLADEHLGAEPVIKNAQAAS